MSPDSKKISITMEGSLYDWLERERKRRGLTSVQELIRTYCSEQMLSENGGGGS